MLNVAFFVFCSECHYAEHRYAEHRYAECRFACSDMVRLHERKWFLLFLVPQKRIETNLFVFVRPKGATVAVSCVLRPNLTLCKCPLRLKYKSHINVNLQKRVF
jgi:hypothetical protein